MFRNPLDDDIADQLASGTVLPEDAPPGYAEVATLLHAARAGTPGAIPGRDALVSDIAATIRLTPGPTPAPIAHRRPQVSKLLTLKALAIALPAMALTAGSAAAATGALPGPAQSAVSHGLSHVGISVPSGTAVGPDATGPAKFGLCTAYQAALARGQAVDHSVAFANLAKAAGGASNISAYCAGVVPASKGSGTTGTGSTSSGDNGASGSNSSTTHKGSTSDGSSTSVPNGPPSSVPVGPPSSVPNGPPTSVPVGPPTSVGSGPPSSIPGSPPSSVPNGPPTSIPASGQSTSNPGASHKS
ncbi:MAG TPA: hypothetical protein VG412_03665 [Acidimicrobiales bacterium]|nr:hypothetical protein [Acidimicrobiales bacterium]